jgi:hypothetical protein
MSIVTADGGSKLNSSIRASLLCGNARSQFMKGTLMRMNSRLLLLFVATAFVLPAAAIAQDSKPVDLPNGPTKPGFDIRRFSNVGNGWFETFYVKETEPLRKVLDEGRVAADTRVLVFQTAGGKRALLMDQMAYHHLAEGRAGGKDWLATF